MRALISALFLLVPLAACDSTSKPTATPYAEPAVVSQVAATQGLTVVTDPTQVCMVTNRYMGAAQIPVEVEGKTYFGCCEMCKARLANEPAIRQAVDPVTQQPVDKAAAVMARQADGQILYFASAETLAKYRTP